MRICDQHGMNVTPVERQIAVAIVRIPMHRNNEGELVQGGSTDVCRECFSDMIPAGIIPGMTITILNSNGEIVC